MINSKKPSSERIKKYEQEGAEFIEAQQLKGQFKVIKKDLIRNSGYIRHNPQKTARLILKLLNK